MFVPVTHFLPLTKIRRERLLPIPGRVLVHTGQKVIATDVIAETKLVNQHVLLDISSILGISSKPDRKNSKSQRQSGRGRRRYSGRTCRHHSQVGSCSTKWKNRPFQ